MTTTGNGGADWQALVRAWRDDPGTDTADDAHGVRRRVMAETRRMTLVALAEYAFATLLVGFVAWRLATEKGTDVLVWGFALLWFTGMALQYSSDARRGLWQPASETTFGYLDLALERIQRRERATRFAWLLFGLEVAFLVAWYPLTWFLWPERTWQLLDRTPWLLAAVGLATLALVGWSVSTAARNRRERAAYERLQHEFAAPA
jgi:hypothetical protein